MSQTFDRALGRALSCEATPFGIQARRLLIVVARRAAADNRIKAMNEAMLGQFHFAKIHEAASLRYHEDAETMAEGAMPKHQPVAHYSSIATAYRTHQRAQAQTETWRKNVA